MAKTRNPYCFDPGDAVENVFTSERFTVKKCLGWQFYAGGDTSDYTILFESTEDQPTPWNKSRNLKLVEKQGS